MPVDRVTFKQPFTATDVPPWKCQRCGAGHLRLAPDSLRTKETRNSRKDREQEGWEPEWMVEQFTALFECDSDACREVIAAAGRVTLEGEYDHDGEVVFTVYHHPTYLQPSPLLFTIPANTPAPIRDQIVKASDLFWSEPGSAVNAIRSAIELMLNDRGIKRFGQKKSGGRSLLSLHNRITIFQNKLPRLAPLLLAAKWIGNEGSHNGEITRDDVFDAADLLEYVLEEVYAKRTVSLEKLSKTIIKKKGPRSK